MNIKIRCVLAITFVSIGCILSLINELWSYVNWYCVVFGLLLSDSIIHKKTFSIHKIISAMIYIWIIVLFYIIRSGLHNGCLDNFISSRKFLITLWLCAIFIIVKRYIEEKEKRMILSNMNNSPSAEK
jgi:hypothetical protein